MSNKKKKVDKLLIFGILFYAILFTACSAEFIRTAAQHEENRKEVLKREEELQEKIKSNQKKGKPLIGYHFR